VVEEQAGQTPLIDPNLIKSTAAAAPVAAATGEGVQVRQQPTASELKPGQFCWGTGRRKASVARVRLRPGQGNFTVNGRGVDEFFTTINNRQAVRGPLQAVKAEKSYDIFVNVNGGGTTGQSGAVVLGLARALIAADPKAFEAMRDGGYLTRDPRMVERKKYGKSGARKRYQFSKR